MLENLNPYLFTHSDTPPPSPLFYIYLEPYTFQSPIEINPISSPLTQKNVGVSKGSKLHKKLERLGGIFWPYYLRYCRAVQNAKLSMVSATILVAAPSNFIHYHMWITRPIPTIHKTYPLSPFSTYLHNVYISIETTI